jgi:AmiR/NasT family two-component response regulator
VVIEQAKGVLAERLRVGPDDAFAVLRNHARRHNTKLRAVAQGVLDGSADVGP